MKDYVAKENLKFVVGIILFLVIGFTIYGVVFNHWERKEKEFYSSAYAKGYDDGINHREYDDSYEELQVDSVDY